MKYIVFIALLSIVITVYGELQQEPKQCAAKENSYNKYYESQISSLKILEERIPSAKKVFATIITRVRCSQAASNERSTPKALECLYKLVPKSSAAVPALLPYPKLESVLLNGSTLILELIVRLQLGLGTVHDVDEAYKNVAIKFAKTVCEM